MEGRQSKITTARDAIARLVHDGAELVIGNYTVGTCAELVFEVVRQGRKDLTLYTQSGIFDADILVAAGCVSRMVTTYVARSGGKSGGSSVERALKDGCLEIEDYSNFNYNARMVAGMHGFSFMQVLEGIRETDLFRKRTFMGEDKYRLIQCPYTHKEILTVPAANPDVCIVHVQRADRNGNAQYWGALGSVAAAALASKHIIVSCEEIVDESVIRASPNLTILPAYRVDAVVECPWGAHPSEVLGYYNMDRLFYGLIMEAMKTADGMQNWLDEWVFGYPDRLAYLDHYGKKFHMAMLNALRAKTMPSAPANYGTAFDSSWDENGRDRTTGKTSEEIELILEQRENLYG